MANPYGNTPIHGHARRGKKTKIYAVWKAMLSRCNHAGNSSYKDYGGRGIKVCKRWMSFVNFHEDMGEIPEGKTLDRIDNEQGYFPANCRWATKNQQARNKRNTSYLTINGVTKPVREWADDFCIKPNTLKKRIAKNCQLEKLFCQPAK